MFTARSPPESPNIEDRMKSLRVDTLGAHGAGSHIGDSGYMSFPGKLPCTGLITPVMSDIDYTSSLMAGSEYDGIQTLEAHLVPHVVDEQSVASVASSVWGGDDRDGLTTSPESWSDIPNTLALEQLSHQIATRGSPRSEVQLRYLLQLFMEASCLEWSLIISILLRDAMAVLRTVNAARSPDQSVEAVMRLKQGMHLLNYWINTECLGYLPFLITIHNQISVLAKILATKVQHQQIIEKQQQAIAAVSSPIPSRSRKTSSNHDSNSHVSSREKHNSLSGSVTSERIKEIDNVTINIDKQNDNEVESEELDNGNDTRNCVIS